MFPLTDLPTNILLKANEIAFVLPYTMLICCSKYLLQIHKVEYTVFTHPVEGSIISMKQAR